MAEDPLDAFRGVLGVGHARAALPDDAILGTRAGIVIEPGSVQDVAAALRLADGRGLAVVPRGSGSKLGWGAPPQRADVVLGTGRLQRVLEHAAGDLVVRAEAGVRLDTLQAQLGGSGQWLALDPPEPRATLGGIVASAASGPRRHRYGTARDLLIGLTVALADGTLAKAGGKVVKNVAGYDLGKLFSGSLGTLGVIVETTFRLHPRPPARRLVVAEPATPATAADAVLELLRIPVVPSAIELRWSSTPGAPGRLAVLFESVPAGAAAQAARALELLAAHAPARLVADDSFEREWAGCIDSTAAAAAGAARARLGLSGLPSRLGETLAGALAVAGAHALSAVVSGRAGLGVLQAELAGTEADLAAAIVSLRRQAAPGDSVVLREAPPSLKRVVDSWGDAGDALPLMRRVKHSFDPNATLSPGRFVGGL